ncbi:lipid IV(A) 3-deoxy-D-manno-octulosonic acid transferase [Rheinheimera muenzenbergensis]|uniref:3-deoxy-D-manno-octulosonic acid kinase n=1 Tax=Rheinheimera muenzenbergensis TaxID=1193628 RepID=A0ABU8C3R1_9GAMM
MSLLSRFCYSLLLCLLSPLLLGYLLWRSRKDSAYRRRLAERFAFKLPAQHARSGIVLHTVSVGEFNAARPLIKQLLKQYPQLPLTITCTTPTASAAILKLQAEQQQGHNIIHCYLPFDFPWLMRRWLAFLQPQLLIILETELWPNLLANCKALAIPTLVVNARLSARSARGYRRLSCLVKPMLQNISQILTQDSASARRFATLAAPKVQLAGNLKYELDVPAQSVALAADIKPTLQGRIVWVAASTHAGEDEMLLQAYRQLRLQYPQLLLVLVPRHPERFDAVAALLQQQQLSYVRRSKSQLPDSTTAVWLADSMGELLSWYQLADFVFIGGSLIERGGHNPLEAMVFAKAVISGPYVFNFQQVFNLLQRQQAYLAVRTSDDIARAVQQLVDQPELAQQLGSKGLALYQQQQGALARTMGEVGQLLPLAGIARLQQGSAVAWFDAAFFPNAGLHYFQPQYWQQQGLVSGQSTGRNTVWFVRQDDKQAVLRHYYRGGLIGKINKDCFWPVPLRQSRAMAEYALLWQMQSWGLPVPRPCAALYQPRRLLGITWAYRADILIERIEGATDLAQLLQQQSLSAAQWQQLGSMIARFHQHSVYHSDLNCHNILLDKQGKFWLIDFDKCALRAGNDWQQATLARLLRSLQKERGLHNSFSWQPQLWSALLHGYQQQLTG